MSAIRPLEAIATSKEAYSILDRQIAVVKDGRWESTLNLWQIAPDGQFQEPWQLANSPINEAFKPLPGVTFSVTLDPKDAAGLKSTIERQDTPQLKAIEKYNVDGELYLQATKTQTVSLPFGSTLPPGNTNTVRDLRKTEAQRVDIISPDESTVGSATIGKSSDANLPPETYLH
ncbi:MAG: hypothetical protein F6K35_43445 [Okeania sp. SIO2H7]|nr:hypothetical protein [Okeania sp. SIO2H7]